MTLGSYEQRDLLYLHRAWLPASCAACDNWRDRRVVDRCKTRAATDRQTTTGRQPGPRPFPASPRAGRGWPGCRGGPGRAPAAGRSTASRRRWRRRLALGSAGALTAWSAEDREGRRPTVGGSDTSTARWLWPSKPGRRHLAMNELTLGHARGLGLTCGRATLFDSSTSSSAADKRDRRASVSKSTTPSTKAIAA